MPESKSNLTLETNLAKGNSATVFYDGACPVCSREINSIEQHVQKMQRDCKAVSEGDGNVASKGNTVSKGNNDSAKQLNFINVHKAESLPLNKAALLHDLHVQFDDGTILVGIDANLFLWRQGPYFRLASIVSQPVIYQCAKYVYGVWSKRRYAKLYSKSATT